MRIRLMGRLVMSSSSPRDPRSSRHKRQPERKRRRAPSSGRKVFGHPERTGDESQSGGSSKGSLPRSIVQVRSPQVRRTVDTFLMNATPVQTAFRALLQGPERAYKGNLESTVTAFMDREACSAASAVSPDGAWRIHATDTTSLNRLLGGLLPSRIEGEAEVVRKALEHPLLAGLPKPEFRAYNHLELTPRKIAQGPQGHHRAAQRNDIPRLERYAEEYKAETDEETRQDWETLIAEKRILLAVFEGTPASVAVRGAETLDRVTVEGVFTFRPFRRRGLARGLVAALARQAAGRGQSVSAIVPENNAPMLALLDKLRFTKTADYLIATFPAKPRSGEDD